MSTETTCKNSTLSKVSDLDYEKTALTLGLLGGLRAAGGTSEAEHKCGFVETMDLNLEDNNNRRRRHLPAHFFGLTLTGTIIGLAVLTSLFLLFSPVLVPAALLLALGVAGILASGAFGLTGLSSLGYLVRQVRAMVQKASEQMDYTMADVAGQVG